MAVDGIDHVQLAIPAGVEPLARRFYGGLLGLAEIPKPPNLAVRGGAWFRCEPVQGFDREFTSDPFGNRIELPGVNANAHS